MVFVVMAVVLWWWRGGRGCGGDVAAGVMMLSGSMMGCGVGWRGGGGEWGELAGGRPKSRRKMGDGVEKLEREERKILVMMVLAVGDDEEMEVRGWRRGRVVMAWCRGGDDVDGGVMRLVARGKWLESGQNLARKIRGEEESELGARVITTMK
ncbi:hypothetical protein Tco_1134575 [Tanacetum coccineum]